MASGREIQWVGINWIHGIFSLFAILEESIAEVSGGHCPDGDDASLEEEEVESEGEEEHRCDHGSGHALFQVPNLHHGVLEVKFSKAI
jgi:hypothetical protein